MGRYEIRPADGSRSNRKRVGRGVGSGRGKTAGKGSKGQKSRSGYTKRPWFEGGQMPLQRRVPKRGFKNIFKKRYQVVNLKDLDRLTAGEVDAAVLREAGLIRTARKPVKILGDGELSRKISVRADAFSASARRSIEAAGGVCMVVGAPGAGATGSGPAEAGVEDKSIEARNAR